MMQLSFLMTPQKQSDRKNTPDCSGFGSARWGEVSPLLQCDARLMSCCCAEPGHAESVLSCWPLSACCSASDRQEFLAGVSSAAPPKLQDSGTSAMQKSIYSQQEGERDRGETETVNGIGAILKLETSRRVMGIHNALLQLFWATLELLWC